MKIYQVDAFTDQIFKGNPAGVCILPPDKIEDSGLLQNIAAEMNVSETAFLSKQEHEYRLRWFTPETEVHFCGHGTLSSAHILWETGAESRQDTLQFDTLSGKLYARCRQDKVELDFPVFEVTEAPPQKDIASALGIEPLFFGTSRNGYLLEVVNYQTLKAMQPDFARLKTLGRAFAVTCLSDNPDYDFYSRFFAPAEGIDEDPVTGSSHTTLAPYWSKKLGKSKLTGYQASKRGGVVECELAPNGRVFLRGYARTVFEIDMKAGC